MKKTFLILSIVAVIGISGYLFYKKQIDKLIDMDYQFVGVKVNTLSLSNSVADLKIQISSDSTLEAKITDLDLDVLIDGVYVGKILDNSAIIIPAKGSSVVSLQIVADASKLYENIETVALSVWKAKDAMLTIRGKAKVRMFGLNIPVPVDYTESVKYLLS